MKVAESKSVATPAKANSSFFNKGADTALLTDSASETPFFNKQTNSPFFVQTKLTIGQPNDKYEQEADHIADKVVQRSAIAPLNNSITPFVQTKCAACEDEEKLQKKEDKEEGDLLEGQLRRKPIFDSNADPDELEGGLSVQKKCAHCEEEEKLISRKGEDSSVEMKSSSVETSLSQSKGTGRQMPEHTRAEMEASIGADFSGVRIHDNSNAAQMNEGLNAQAFAHGNDIYFSSGKYDPETTSGKHLLAHELTHTVQQGGAAIQKKDHVHDKSVKQTDAATPNIQASWYNFSIPFTDYEFDPSISGLKTAGNLAVDTAVSTGEKIKEGANWVKDKVEEGFVWVFDKIKGLVNDGIAWLSEKFESIKQFAVSSFNSIKDALASALGFVTAPLSTVYAAFTNMDANKLLMAWNALTAGANSVLQTVSGVINGVLNIGGGIWSTVSGFVTSIFNKIGSVINSTVFGYLPDFLQKSARALYNTIRSLWDSIRNFWTEFWRDLKAHINKILTSIRGFINKILSYAINGIIKVVKSLKEAYDLVKLVTTDPIAYIKPSIDKLTAKLNGEAPPKAKAIASEKLKENAPNALTVPSVGGVIQRAPESANSTAKVERSTASYTEIDQGINKSITDEWGKLKIGELLWQTVTNMFWPPATIKAIGHEFYELWTVDWANAVDNLFAPRSILDDPLGFFHDLWSNFLVLLDFPLALWRRLNSVLMLLMGYVTIILVIVGFCFAGVGAAAGLALAGAIGEALMVSFLLAEGTTIIKALLDLFTARQTAVEKQRDYKQIAGSTIGIGIAIVLEVLFAILAELVSIVVARIKGKPAVPAPEAAAKPGEPPKVGEPAEPKPAEGEAKGAEPPKAAEGEVSPSQDGKRDLRINEEGKCEVCASPCADIEKKYAKEITSEIKAKIDAIETNKSLSEAAKKEQLKPIEQELADLQAKASPQTINGIKVGDEITLPRKGGRTRGKVVGMDEKFVKVEYEAGAGEHGNVTQSIPRETFQKMVVEGEIVPTEGLYNYLIENRPKYREGVVDKVWEQAKAQGNGKVIDPLTKKELTWDRTRSRTDQWDMGHKYGSEYRELVRKRANGEITQEQFLNEYNKPENYQPEHPPSNQSHAGEKK
jgi:hypothetical protein